MNSKSDQSARVAVLVSGGGRSLVNLGQQIATGELNCSVALVLSDRKNIGALDRAREAGLESAVVPRQQFDDHETFGRAVFAEIEQRNCQLVILAGFLRLLPIPEAWLGRVINIHPSLLPAFGGKGYFGNRVHEAVLKRGVQFTGCSVHYVTNEYDMGPILLQRCIEVRYDDDVQSLANRVFEEEKIALPEAIRRHLAGEVRWSRGQVVRERSAPVK